MFLDEFYNWIIATFLINFTTYSAYNRKMYFLEMIKKHILLLDTKYVEKFIYIVISTAVCFMKEECSFRKRMYNSD